MADGAGDRTGEGAGIECILAPNPSLMTGPGTNTYLVRGAAGAGCVVIDPGPDSQSHLAQVAERAAAAGGASAILITHGHPDHLEGAPQLRALTGAPILAWSRTGSPAADEELADGATLAVGGRAIQALHTPGHRFDHLCFLLPEGGVLFAGDLVAGTGTVVIAPPEGDLLDYMASLRRLLALDLERILPAHGPAIERPRDLLEDYLHHREERERQVLACLAAGPTTVTGLVKVIYLDVDPQLHPVAALTVTAHLQKLEREGRVRRRPDAAGAAGTSGTTGKPGEETWQLAT